MAGMGPPPKPADQRRRRNKPLELTVLPREGRDGPAPKWPLSRMQAGEAAAWTEVWCTPQAVEWDELGWVRTVARYVRVLVASEKPDASTAVLSECRQMEDRLGLTPMAMLRLRWSIGEPEATPVLAPVTQLDGRWQRTGTA